MRSGGLGRATAAVSGPGELPLPGWAPFEGPEACFAAAAALERRRKTRATLLLRLTGVGQGAGAAQRTSGRSTAKYSLCVQDLTRLTMTILQPYALGATHVRSRAHHFTPEAFLREAQKASDASWPLPCVRLHEVITSWLGLGFLAPSESF